VRDARGPHATLHVYHGGHVELATRPSLLTPLITSFLAAPPHDSRRAEQVQTGRHPEHQSPRQAADGTAAAQATAGADALAEALQAARAAQQAAETAAALRDAREQAAAAQAAAREQAAAPEGASALCAGEGLTGQDLVTAPNRGSGAAGTRARSHIPRSGCRRRHPGCCVITDVWAIHLSGPDENRPLDAVVMAARRTKILGLVRLTECPLLTLSGNTA
jgi:hypothetical protein